MRFGFDTKPFHPTRFYQLTPEELFDAMRAISRAHFDGFETMDVNVSPFFKERRKFINILSETKLQLAAIHVWGDFYTIYKGIHPKIWWRRRRWLRRLIPSILEFASAVGCERLLIEGPLERTEGANERDIVSVARGLNKVGRLCDDFGVEATYHPFNHRQIISSRDRLEKLCELTDPSFVHLTIDVQKAVNRGIDPTGIISEYIERTDHIHLRDIKKDGKPVEIGEGTIDLVGIYNLLKTVGYNDWVIVQHGLPALKECHSTPSQSVERAGKYISEYLLSHART